MLSEKIYSVGRVIIDSSFHTQSADETFFSYFGNDVIYSIRRTIEENDFQLIENCMKKLSQGEISRTVIRMKGINSELRWILADVRIFQTSPEKLYSIGFCDIFSLENLLYAREKNISEYRFLLSLSSDLGFCYSFETKKIRIFMFDSSRDIVLFEENLDIWKKNVLGKDYVSARYIETFESLCNNIQKGVYRFEHELETSMFTEGKNKEYCLFKGITRFQDPETRTVTGIVSVISSRQKTKEINTALETNRDFLSGLLNKRAVTSFAMNLIKEKKHGNVNLVILEIDNFTEINNSYGHLFGDQIIYTVAEVIKKEINKRGIAGRISGYGFLIVLEDTADETDLRGILRAIRTNIEYAFSDRFENFRPTCSMGVSTCPIDSTDYDELFMQADKALYIAQQKGRNRYVIYDIEKHGAVEKDVENKIVFLGSRKNINDRLAFVGNLSESLVFGRIPDISVLLEQIRSQFSIDDICVFAGNDMNLILSCGNAVSKNASYLLENRYTERFSGDNIFAIDNVNELEGRDDNAFAMLKADNIGGAVQYLITEESIIKGMISFCYIGRFKKWADSDINYFAVIGRVISAVLKKQTFI